MWVDAGGEVLGHVSYGPDGRIPTAEGYPYPDSHLDIGLGPALPLAVEDDGRLDPLKVQQVIGGLGRRHPVHLVSDIT